MLAGLARLHFPSLRRGNWTPPDLGTGAVLIILLALAIDSTVRAVDYATGRDGAAMADPLRPGLQLMPPRGLAPPGIATIELAMPLWVWATGLGFGALVLAMGMTIRWRGAVWLGHSVLGTLYAALAVGYASDAANTPYFDGLRGAATLALPAVLHTTLGWHDAPRRARIAGTPPAVETTAEE